MHVLYKNGSYISSIVDVIMIPNFTQMFGKSGNCFQEGRQNENKYIFITSSYFLINTCYVCAQLFGFVGLLSLINWIKWYSIRLQSWSYISHNIYSLPLLTYLLITSPCLVGIKLYTINYHKNLEKDLGTSFIASVEVFLFSGRKNKE